MEKEQLEKKVEWLDGERRKALAENADLQKRLEVLEKALLREKKGSANRAESKQRIKSVAEQVDEIETDLAAHIADVKKQLAELNGQRKTQDKVVAQDQKGMSKILDDFRKEIGELQAMRKSLNEHSERLLNLGGRVPQLEESIASIVKSEHDRAQAARTMEKHGQEDLQRMTELRGEVTAMLSRLEAAAKRTETVLDAQRKVDKRFDEIIASEAARGAAQREFFEQSAAEADEAGKRWRDWSKRFDLIEQQSLELSQHLKSIETTDLAVKRAQKSFDELIEKINRRVNELGEIQRLGDQRFRQEWSTFQADSQKRWANFTLTHEEQQRENSRQRDKLGDQITALEDSVRDVQDGLQHLTDQSERNLQALLEMARDSLSENERFLSNQR
jgi:chromosome segregation ATPase